MQYRCQKCRRRFETTQEMRHVGFCPGCGEALADGLSGLMVDDFQIVAQLGRGANGMVYLGWQLPLAREAAVKLLPSDRVGDSQAIRSFFEEARATARFCHPNIVQALQAGVTPDGVYFFAMELVDGKNLETIIEQYGPPKYSEALSIASKLAAALEYTWHRAEMIHGDIKPANILMTASGEPKLADLGLAQFGAMRYFEMATPLYVSPEVIEGDCARINFKADIYSFGATLYEIFSGEPPFFDTEPERVLEMQLYDQPMPLERRLGFFDPTVSRFIDRMLEKDPDRRPTSWRMVADFLRERDITANLKEQ